MLIVFLELALYRFFSSILLSLFVFTAHVLNADDGLWNWCFPTPEKVEELQEEQLVHECGLAFVRLRKPISYYAEHYQDPAWGVNKLVTMMEKQRNRGQDGAGIAVVKLNMSPGQEYLHRLRFAENNSIDTLFEHVINDLQPVRNHQEWLEKELKQQSMLIGELLLGHLRYATHSGMQVKYCQPFVRPHEIACRHFALAGNFNMTNTPELFRKLEHWGLSPVSKSDTQVILDTLAYNLDQEYDRVASESKDISFSDGPSRSEWISKQIDLVEVLKKSAQEWDGGYVFCGILGNGDAFICRDPAGIRPGYIYINEDVFAAASERVALMDAFDVEEKEILPIEPGHVIVFKQNGTMVKSSFTNALPERQCTFERIYFSKANDRQIYEERKSLGKELASEVFQAIEGDLEHTVFTYVPNSSFPAFQGLVEEVGNRFRRTVVDHIKKGLETDSLNVAEIEKLALTRVRSEALIAKNQRVRTFISADQGRKKLVAQLYEVTQGIVSPEDTVVVVDDSIVRGMTLRESLIKKLIGLNPKKIIIVSSAPPVLYPDCYGIDMSQIGRFVAFQAAISLIEERQQADLLDNIKKTCQKQNQEDARLMDNDVKKIYEHFTLKEISESVARLITPTDTDWKGSIQVIYQSLEGLHRAIPGFSGDWVFSGDYPTPGGLKVLNTSYLNWCEGKDSRSY